MHCAASLLLKMLSQVMWLTNMLRYMCAESAAMFPKLSQYAGQHICVSHSSSCSKAAASISAWICLRSISSAISCAVAFL